MLPPTQMSHNDQSLTYLIGDGKYQTMPGSQVVSITHAGPIPGHIDSEAYTGSSAYLATGTLIPHGEESAMVIPVHGHI